MCAQENVATVAFLIADPGRAAMLMSLVDGRARPAGELALAAGVSAQTASSHLGKLLAGGLVTVETQGRHRYYRLAGPHVAHALENLAAIVPAAPARKKAFNPETERLRLARCCYDHLAGRVGVAVAHGLLERGFIVAAAGKRFEITQPGVAWFDRMGLDVAKLKPNPRGLARQCLDWSERDHHLAGPLGVEFMSLLCANGWLRRAKSSRAVEVTPKGWAGLREQLGVAERAMMP